MANLIHADMYMKLTQHIFENRKIALFIDKIDFEITTYKLTFAFHAWP